MEKLSDSWGTPQWLFDELNAEFDFKIDLAATRDNKKCRDFAHDYLSDIYVIDGQHMTTTLTEGSHWLNPPYGNPRPFVEKAYRDSKKCAIVLLLKCDTSTKTWGVFYDYEKQQAKPGVQIRFLPKRVKFEAPKEFEGKVSGASFASVLVIMDRRGL